MPKIRRDGTGFSRKLLDWYRYHHRKLPWRETRHPYRIWVSEIMLQQTTVAAVIPYYEKWLKTFPDVRSLARAPLRKVLKAWQGLGYYRRAMNLHKAARIIVGQFGGELPRDEETLRTLPGFGPYTTAAVLSLAFDRPCPVLDANVRRVAMRLLALENAAGSRAEKAIMDFLNDCLPKDHPGLFNQAMMELGALVCRPAGPLCLLCPVVGFCRAFDRGIQEIIPPSKKQSFQKVETVVAIIRDDGRYLIQQRPAQGLFAGLWEFPGGKKEWGETLEEALRREVREELGAEVQEAKFLFKVRHAYTRFLVTLYAYEVSLKGCLQLRKGRHRRVTINRLKQYPFHSGSAKIIQFLEKRAKMGE